MTMKIISDINVKNKKALVRCDFNVPIFVGREVGRDKEGIIRDDTRIVEALPTIRELLKKGAAVILMSHLGRPKGEVKEEFSLNPVAKRISELLGLEVKFSQDTVGETAKRMSSELKSGEVLLLENLRFSSSEEDNDPVFSEALAELADIFIQDAFGTVHRKHSSMVGVPSILPSVAGRLLEKEIKYLSMGLDPKSPLVVCLGGAKIETKIGIIKNMMGVADTLLIGGGMAYTLLKVKGYEIGKSLLDENYIDVAEDIIKNVEKSGFNLKLPSDYIVTDDISNPKRIEKTVTSEIPADLMGVDIGEKTILDYTAEIMVAKTIILNGPMGVFEKDEFSNGTRKILEAIVNSTKNGAFSIVGGGDTISAINNFGFNVDDFSHVSTGGGASLKFLEGAELPGIKVLD